MKEVFEMELGAIGIDMMSLFDIYIRSRGPKKPPTPTAMRRWLQKIAAQGNEEAMFYLGCCYLEGFGAIKDTNKGIRWLKKAARNGHVIAQHYVGVFYYFGYWVQKNHAEAVRWLKKAAEGGDADACTHLGCCYAEGHGVKQDNTENSSSSSVRKGTPILKWNRLKTVRRDGKPVPAFNWEELNGIIGQYISKRCNLSEEGFQDFLRNAFVQNPKIITQQ